MDIILLVIICTTYLEFADALLSLVQIAVFRHSGKVFGYRRSFNNRSRKHIAKYTTNSVVRKTIVKLLLFTALLIAEFIYVATKTPESISTVLGVLLLGTVIIAVVQQYLIGLDKRRSKPEDWLP
jgi:hypothetical protein